MTEVTTRGSIPSQAVNRHPLPERDFITLCELVTWLATGKARSAAVLRRLMQRHQGQRRPTALWRAIENEAAKLISLLRLRSREVEAFGHVDHGARRPIPFEYLVNAVFAEPPLDIIAPDPLARLDSDDVPTYRSVCFFRTDVQRTFGIAGNRSAADDATARDDELRRAAELSEPADPRSSAVRPNRRGRKKGSWGYDSKDAPLLEKIHGLVENKNPMGLWDAALTVVDLAPGKGNTESRTKRLVKKFKAKHALR